MSIRLRSIIQAKIACTTPCNKSKHYFEILPFGLLRRLSIGRWDSHSFSYSLSEDVRLDLV